MSDEPTLESQQRLARAFERLGPLLKQIGENRGQPGRLRELVRYLMSSRAEAGTEGQRARREWYPASLCRK